MSDKEIALAIIRGSAAGAGVTAKVSGDPVVSAVAVLVQGILATTAKLVEQHGAVEAEKKLRELIDNPAKPISDADLDEDVEVVKRELGL